MTQWASLLPQRQKTRVRIPKRNKVFRENIAILQCVIDLICIVCVLKKRKKFLKEEKNDNLFSNELLPSCLMPRAQLNGTSSHTWASWVNGVWCLRRHLCTCVGMYIGYVTDDLFDSYIMHVDICSCLTLLSGSSEHVYTCVLEFEADVLWLSKCGYLLGRSAFTLSLKQDKGTLTYQSSTFCIFVCR
jgi:hypothetical protein